MKKTKRKRCIEGNEQDSSRPNDQVSSQVKVAENATKCVIKEEVAVEVSTAAVKNHRGQTRSAMKRKRSNSADVSDSMQGQVDSVIMPSRRKKTVMTSDQNGKSLQQDKHTGQSVNKKQPLVKERQSTRTKRSASEAQEKKASKEPLQKVSVANRQKSTKVKHVSPIVKAVDKTSVKTGKPDV